MGGVSPDHAVRFVPKADIELVVERGYP
jgi:hypothetical protein